jgi:glycosyltransferase involved in cell wall biosynthesis
MSAARRTASRVELFVANAHAVAENVSVAFGVDPERVRVIHDGIEPGRWASAEPADLSDRGVAFGAPLAVCVARLHPQKGLEELVDAVGEVTGRTGLHLAIAGDGPSRPALQARIDAAGLGHRVILLGERNDVPELLAGASLFVLASRFEGLPTAIIEAMMAGCPVVATDVGGNRELVVEGSTGWLVPPRDVRALAASIVRAMHADLDRIGQAGRRRAEDRFSASAMTSGFADLYRSVLAGHRQPGRALERVEGPA